MPRSPETSLDSVQKKPKTINMNKSPMFTEHAQDVVKGAATVLKGSFDFEGFGSYE